MPAAKRAKKATRAKKSTKVVAESATKSILLVDDDAGAQWPKQGSVVIERPAEGCPGRLCWVQRCLA